MAARKVRGHSRQEWFQDRELRQHLQAAFSEEGSGSDPFTYAVASIVLDRIMQLPTQQRITTFLRLALGWTGPEIAQFLDITAATVYVHEHRGRQAVQRSEGESHPLSGTAPGGSYRSSRAERPSVPRLLAAWALLLLMIAAIAGLVWLVGAAWVMVAIIGCLFTVGAWIFRRD